MVQFLPSREFGTGFAESFAEVFRSAFERGQQERQGRRERLAESSALKEAGFDVPSSIKNPKLRESLLKGQVASQQTTGDLKKESERAKTIGKYFGEQAAELYPHLTEGGKTKLFEELLNGKVRNIGTEQILGKYIQENPQEAQSAVESITRSHPKEEVSLSSETKTPSGEIKTKEEVSFPKIDLGEGRLPKEIPAYKKEIRKENVPLFQEANSKIKSLKNERDHLKILDKLSPKVPDGIGRVFVNKMGQIRPWAQILKLVPPEAERFVKTVNDFISGAKDIFGSRVTNFDLQMFQSRLPTLINTAEGRKQIIDQMNIFNEIESNYQEALKKVYQHYGLEGIPQEKAEELATQLSSERESELRKQLSSSGLEDFDLSEMPNAQQNSGRIIEDSEGNRYRSNGETWERI